MSAFLKGYLCGFCTVPVLVVVAYFLAGARYFGIFKFKTPHPNDQK